MKKTLSAFVCQWLWPLTKSGFSKSTLAILLVACSLQLQASPYLENSPQGLTVSGKVLDDQGSAVPGVNVIEKGTTNGTTTDADGKYTMSVGNASSTLVFSFIGFVTQEVAVGTKTTIDINFVSDVKALEEIVVVGYGTQNKKDISIAATELDSKAINTTIQSSLSGGLQGRVSGVTITSNSGAPGSASTVRVRGVSSWNNSEPLYVVDNVILGGGAPDYLSSADVESMTVLKDAAATAIYGARGANGVILITTKSGKFNQKTVVSYEGSYGVQTVARKLNLLNAQQYATLNNEGYINAGRAPQYPEFADPSKFGKGTDWQDAIFQAAPIQQHQLSVSGGSSASNFYLSGSHFDQNGIVGGDKSNFTRSTLVATINTEVADRLKISTNITLSHRLKNNLSENNIFGNPVIRAINMDPITPTTLPDGSYAASLYQETDIKNPLNSSIALNNNTYAADQLVGGINLSYKIIEGLTIEPRVGVNLSYGESRSFTPSYKAYTTTGIQPSNEIVSTNNVGNFIQKYSYLQNENLLRYKRTFGTVHNLEAVVGTAYSVGTFTDLGASQEALPTNDFENAYISSGTNPSALPGYGGFSRNVSFSVFGRFNYDYDKRYFLTASYRRDASSKFGANYRAGYFPAFSAAWVISKESFFQVPAISFLKLRAGYGSNGNDRSAGDYDFLTTVTNGYTYNTAGVKLNGAAPTVPANPDLRWEEVVQTNLGLNVGLLNDRLTFEIDVYDKTTNDVIAFQTLPGNVGALRFPKVNIGNVSNKGIEIKTIYKQNFGALGASFELNGSYNKNEVIKINSDIQGGEIFGPTNQTFSDVIGRTAVGTSIGAFYGYKTNGLFQSNAEVAANLNKDGKLIQPDAVAGDIRFVDVNNDGVIDAKDRTLLGSPIPTVTLGFNTSLTYKGFDMTVFLQGSAGMQVIQAITKTDFNGANRLATTLDRWTGPGTSNSEPRFTFDDANKNNRFSDRFVKDADYLRIKTLQIGYTLPSSLLQKARLTNVRIYASVQNLATFTNYIGFDPEIGSTVQYQDQPTNSGIDQGYFPLARIVSGGVQIKF
jgi:TonB-dependent starch-binding outer membrane protein SusC